jgi:glutathione S-transferase
LARQSKPVWQQYLTSLNRRIEACRGFFARPPHTARVHIREPQQVVEQDNSKTNPSSTITITAFERSPDGGKGLARDTRVRWALEEVGEPYEVRLVSFRAMKEPAHRALHPFGQIPTYEEGDLTLFETGAIVFHIAERHAGLLPDDANARARAITWVFAARSTVEPPILELGNAKLLEGDKPWRAERLPLVEDRVRGKLTQLSVRLGDADWLDGAFSAGDLMMVSVLLRLKPSGILDEYTNLTAYVARGEVRPAYKRARGEFGSGFGFCDCAGYRYRYRYR